MSKLPKYTLDFDERREQWRLKSDKTNKQVKTFQQQGRCYGWG